MSAINKVRGRGKLEIVLIGHNPPGGGTALQFGYSCAIVRKDSVNNPGQMTNILVNYGNTSEDFDIVQAGLESCPNPQLDIITADDIDAFLPTSLSPNHIDKIPAFIQKRTNPTFNKVDVIVDTLTFGQAFLNAVTQHFPSGTNVGSYFNILDINTLGGKFDDITIDYVNNTGNVYDIFIDELVRYTSDKDNLIKLYGS